MATTETREREGKELRDKVQNHMGREKRAKMLQKSITNLRQYSSTGVLSIDYSGVTAVDLEDRQRTQRCPKAKRLTVET